VKGAIANLAVSEARKEILVCVYSSFCKKNEIPFDAPRYHRVEKIPFVPLESEVDQLIAGLSGKYATVGRDAGRVEGSS
jgi:hypothetical protein